MEKISVNKLGGSFFTAQTVKYFFDKFFENKKETDKNLFVVSAMKGITRLLRLIFIVKTEIKIDDDLKNLMISLSMNDFKKSHLELINGLFVSDLKDKAILDFEEIVKDLESLISMYDGNVKADEDKFYASILKFGELASSDILNNYLNSIKIENIYFDARDFVTTDDNFREAKILDINTDFDKFFLESNILITQGFIAKNKDREDTVVGFDGSDYSASKFGNSLIKNVSSKNVSVDITFWKDVDGVYTENPTKNKDAKLIKEMTRSEYIENVKQNGTFVVRPDSISDLDENIAVSIRSFFNLENIGTSIYGKQK